MLAACGIAEQQLFHLRLDEIWLHGFMMRPHNADGNPSVNAAVFLFVGKYEIMDLFYKALAERSVFFNKLSHEAEGFFMPDRFNMVFQRFAVNRKAAQNKVCFSE